MLKEKPTRNDLLEILDGLFFFGNENLQVLYGDLDRKDDENVYYLGLLERATVFSDDIGNILKNTRTGHFMSVYILGRCIMDDYITLQNVKNVPDPREEIFRINADAMRQNFGKMEELVVLNQQVYGSKFPFYPTPELMQTVRERFLQRTDVGRYIENPGNATPESMKFKPHKTLKTMAEMSGSGTDDDMGRAYYFWRQWSDFVHFSPFCFNLSYDNEGDLDTLYKSLQELLTYLYRIIHRILRHYIENKNYRPVDSKGFVVAFNKK